MQVKGSITIFLSMILAVLIGFSGIIVDASRLRAGKKHAQAAVQLSVQSALTQFHAPLKEHYGLMATGEETEDMEALIYDLLEKNLAAENRYMPGYVDLFGFEVERVKVTPLFNLSEDYVLEQQITQFMKYRAPVNAIGDFIGKLTALNQFMAQSGIINQKMELEKKLQKIREEQVYLSLLCSEKINRFTENGKTIPGLEECLLSAMAEVDEIERLEDSGSELESLWRTIPDQIESIKKAEEQRDNPEIEQDTVEMEQETLQHMIDACVEQLNPIQDSVMAIDSQMEAMSIVIRKTFRYHEQSAYLLNQVEAGCKKISQMASQLHEEIEKQSEKADSAFLTRMKTDIQKLILNADLSVIQEKRREIESNKVLLTRLLTCLNEAERAVRDTHDRLGRFIKKTKNLSEEEECFDREVFSGSMDEALSLINHQAGVTAGGYTKLQYPVEPGVNQKERNEFNRWCNLAFNEDNPVDMSRDKGYQKKVKQNIQNQHTSESQQNQRDYHGRDEVLSETELQAIFSTLPSSRSPDAEVPLAREEKGDFEKDCTDHLNSNGSMAGKIGEVLAERGEDLIKSLYVNEFIISAFKNANRDTIKKMGVSLAGMPDKTFFDKAEAEYVLFGARKEKTNAALAQTSIFSIRLGLNLVHVYTQPDKTGTALTLATAIAGWTGFAVPLVKNLILIGWAAGESWLDMKDINEGKPVPVYKTKYTWKLDLESLFTGVSKDILNESADWLKETGEEFLDEGERAVRSMVEEMVSSLVQESFLPLEQYVTDWETVHDPIEYQPAAIDLPESFTDIQDLKAWIGHAAQKQFGKVKSDVIQWSLKNLEEYKMKTTEMILALIFESTAFKELMNSLKGGMDDLINSGVNQLTEAVDKLGNQIEEPGVKEKLMGSVVSFDYIDYLRLLLLVVPQKTKVLRTADLMQLNMMESLDNPEFLLSDYHTYLIIETDIHIRHLFLHRLGKDSSTIKIRWGYGY